MDNDTLLALDRFRELWGRKVIVSKADGALGRADDSHSQHNILEVGLVKAVDFFPEGLNASNFARAEKLAEQAGFTGIGLYTDTSAPMMHGDTREGNPARWSRDTSLAGRGGRNAAGYGPINLVYS